MNRRSERDEYGTFACFCTAGLVERIKVAEQLGERGESLLRAPHCLLCFFISQAIFHLTSILANETWLYNMFIKTWLRFPFKQVKCEGSNKHPNTTRHSTSGNRQQSCQMSILSYSALPNEPTQPNPAFANRTRRSTQSCCETSRRPAFETPGTSQSFMLKAKMRFPNSTASTEGRPSSQGSSVTSLEHP